MYTVRHAAERLAVAEAYPRVAAQEIALITSELAWNIIRHAGRGAIVLSIVVDPRYGPGLEIHACDDAPPIVDLALAQRDGHTAVGPIPVEAMLRRRGIGSGLGAVVRLGDRLLQEVRDQGKCLIVTRFLARPRPT